MTAKHDSEVHREYRLADRGRCVLHHTRTPIPGEREVSDMMMFGIAKMPYELAMRDELSRRQFYTNTQRLLAALEAALVDAEPAAWVAADTLNSPHPVCISSLAYMSQLDKDRGREYVPLYAAPVAAIDALRERMGEKA